MNIVGTENVNLKEAFEREHWDLKSLLKVLRDYISLDMSKHVSARGAGQLEVLYLSCLDWIEDDYEVIKD